MRTLVKEPLFSLAAVLSLALGIGANTAIFSAVDSLLFRPLPLRDLDRNVIVYDAGPATTDAGTAFGTFAQVRDRRDTFSAVMAIAGARPVMLSEGGQREPVFAELVAGDFFMIADVTLALGRLPGADVGRGADTSPEVVLSHAFWQRRFGSDPDIIGAHVLINGQPLMVAGVAAPEFRGVDTEVAADLWMSASRWAQLVGESARLTSGERWLTTVATLQPGVSLEQARSVVAQTGVGVAESNGLRTRVRPARERHIGTAMTDTLVMAAGAFAAGVLLLALACANVTSLLLARAAARQREVSVRMALGSTRWQIVRLWLSECLMLSVLASALGLLLAWWILDLAVAFRPPALVGDSGSGTLPLAFTLDARVFVFTLLLATVVALVIGVIAGLQGSRATAMSVVRSDRATERRFAPGFNVRSGVIALQMALSLLLLIPCGLFVRSALNASEMHPGFSDQQVLLLPISTKQMGVTVNKPEGFEQQLLDRIAGVPGIEHATVMDPVPLWFGGKFARFAADEWAEETGTLRMGYACVGPGYFDTLKIPLRLGRDFDRSDTGASQDVVIVNETLARRFWPGRSPLGQRIRAYDEVLEVVGVAADAKYLSLGETGEPWLYRPIAQEPSNNPALSLAIRTRGHPLEWRDAVEREVKALLPGWPSFQFRTLDEGVQLQRQFPRYAALVLGSVGALGALLAAVGIYGVMAFAVHQRTREIGIRLALGAPHRSVMRLMIRQGMAVCAAGGALGLVMALGATQFIGSVLFGVGAADPLAYGAMSALLAGVAWAACYLPARRATRVNPVVSLQRD